MSRAPAVQATADNPARADAPVRTTLVGLGVHGRVWAEQLAASPAAELVAVVDADPGARRWAAATLQPAPAVFASVDDVLALSGSEAVVVAVPPSAHHAACRTALKAGKHVLVEKPFTLDLDEAEELVRLAADADLRLMVNQNYRFLPAAEAIAALLAERAVGDLVSVRISCQRAAEDPADHHIYTLPYAYVFDLAIHHLDLALALTRAQPRRAYATGWCVPGSGFETTGAMAAIVELADGTPVVYDGAYGNATTTSWSGDWLLTGTEGAISWTGIEEPEDDVVEILRPGEPSRAVELAAPPRGELAAAVERFGRAIRDGSEPESSGAENLTTLRLVVACTEAMATGRTVDLSRETEGRA